MKTQTQEEIKKGIELRKTLANTITAESGSMFELHMACGYLGDIGAKDSLLDSVNDSNNKEYNKIFSKLSNYICGTRG